MAQDAFRKGNITAFAASVSTDATVDVPAHSSIVVSVCDAEWDFNGGTFSISDDKSSGAIAWTGLTKRSSGGSGPAVQLFYCADTGSSAFTAVTFTASFTVNQRRATINVHLLSGMDTAAFYVDDDVAVGLSQTVVTTPSLTTPDACMVFAVACASNDRSFAEDTGFTEDYDRFPAIGSGNGQSQHNTFSAGANPTVTTTASASSNLVIAAAAFKVAAAGSSIAAIANHLKQQGIS